MHPATLSMDALLTLAPSTVVLAQNSDGKTKVSLYSPTSIAANSSHSTIVGSSVTGKSKFLFML
jgi:hypothetical protein